MRHISWWGPRPKPDIAYPRAGSLIKLAEDSDVLFVAAKADGATEGLINSDVLTALGPGGYLINVSRGFTVDEDALIAALKEGRLAVPASMSSLRNRPRPHGGAMFPMSCSLRMSREHAKEPCRRRSRWCWRTSRSSREDSP